MTEDTNPKSKPPLAKQAALTSVVAPGIAVVMNVMTITVTQDSPTGKLAIGIAGSSLIVAGLVCAVIGLLGIRKHGKKGILGRSIAGLLINGFLIVSAFFTFQRMQHLQEQRMQTGLAVAMPATFVEFPTGMQQPDIVYSFIKGDATDDSPDILCFVEDLGGTIRKDDDLSGLAAARPDMTIFKEDWKGHRIDVFRVQESLHNVKFLTFSAQIPLLPNAVQVKIIGLMDRESELRKDLSEVLAGIDGPTNW